MRESMEKLIEKIQTVLQNYGIDGWLFCDFHGRNEIALRILFRSRTVHTTRRWYYYVPAKGTPKKLCHIIEPDVLNHLPGERTLYLSWRELHSGLATMVEDAQVVALEYSPENTIPYVSLIDAGTIELIRKFGIRPVSSADLVQEIEAVLTDEEVQSHLRTAQKLIHIKDRAFLYVRERIQNREKISEYDVQCFIMSLFKEQGLVTDAPPIVAVNENAGNPHYAPSQSNFAYIEKDNVLLIDLWAKEESSYGIYGDITWVAYTGDSVPEHVAHIFDIVYRAQQSAFQYVREAYEQKREVFGAQLDDVARKVISDEGYGKYFIHRTGHNVGVEVHGYGANLDNLETQDYRKILPGTVFTIEPGIYLETFGIRSEIDVYYDMKRGPYITTTPHQEYVIPLLR